MNEYESLVPGPGGERDSRRAEPPGPAGRGLPDALRRAMELRFRTSFAEVRIHTGDEAEALGASAFTAGRDIHFARGLYPPRTASGLGLLAHELTHVVQQREGRFGAARGRIARARLELEREAERNARDLQSSNAPLSVHGLAAKHEVLRSPGLLEELRARAFGDIASLASHIVARSSSPLIRNLSALRLRLSGLRELNLDADLLARCEALHAQLRAQAPSWVPIPAISFAGPPVQCAAIVAIPVAMILLFLAFVIVMIWLLGNLDPATRRARERAVQELLDSLREALRARPRPAPEPEEPRPEAQTRPRPEPEPRNEPRPRERLGPDPIPDSRPRRPETGSYPLLWPALFGPPMLFDQPITSFVKTPQQERDLSYSWEVRRELWARHHGGDPDLMPRDYHAHHIVPLFLGGMEGARGNITFLPGRLHLRGHGQLASQPQMRTPPPPLAPLPANLLSHPSGTRYTLAGFK